MRALTTKSSGEIQLSPNATPISSNNNHKFLSVNISSHYTRFFVSTKSLFHKIKTKNERLKCYNKRFFDQKHFSI